MARAMLDRSAAAHEREFPATALARLWLAIEIVAWFLAYVGVGALVVRFQPASEPALWYPPIVIGTALLLRRGMRWVPIVLLADLVVSHWQYPGWTFAAIVAVNTAVEALLAATFLRRFGAGAANHRASELPIWLFFGSFAAAIIGATIGVLVTTRTGTLESDKAFSTWFHWWIGDGTSLVALLPAFLLWPRRVHWRRLAFDDRRWVERTLLVVCASIIAALLFDQLAPLTRGSYGALLVLGLAPIIWSAIRFDIGTTAWVVVWTSVLSALLTHLRVLDQASTTASSVLEMQVYIMIVSMGGLGLSGAIQREREARRDAERATAEMSASVEHLALAARAGQIGSFEFRSVSGSLQWSDSMFELLGISPRSVAPSVALWAAHIPEQEREPDRRRFEALCHREGGFSYEQGILSERGEGRMVSVRGETLRVEGELRTLGIIFDVTEHHRAKMLSSQLAAIIESSEDAILSIAPDGRIQSWNRGAERMFGHSAQKVIGQHKLMMVPPECADEFRTSFARTLREERARPIETVRLHADGHLVHVLESMSPVRDPSGQLVAVAVILHDISALRGLEARLRQSQKMEAVGRLAGGVAHDFNNMLTAILGFNDLVSMSLPQDALAQADVLQIRKAGERAAALTRQLLAFSRRQEQKPGILRLGEVLTNLEPMLRRLIGEDVQMVFSVASDDVPILADPSQVEQILMNLVVNARDAMPDGGRLEVATSAVQLDEHALPAGEGLAPGRYAMLTVTDCGTGMDDATRARIFEPFFTTKESGHGTGLGLSTVHEIVRQNHGAIWVFTEQGRGTTFRIALPQQPEGAVQPVPVVKSAPLSSGGETVVVVEDEPQVLEFVRSCLVSAGYTVLSVSHPQEATQMLRTHIGAIDRLVTDIVLPKLNGAEIARIARRYRPEIALLFMSGLSQTVFTDDAPLPEHASLLPKPFSRQALLVAVREAMHARVAREAGETFSREAFPTDGFGGAMSAPRP